MSRRDIEDIYPLSPMQRGMLLETLAAPGAGIHVEQMHCRLSGELDLERFRHAWQLLVDRHPMLRSAFVWKEREEPLQVLLRRAALPFEERDWRDLPEVERQRRVETFLASDRQTGFQLAKPPLLRLALLRLGERSWRLVATHHHALMDGWCVARLVREGLENYAALRSGRSIEVRPSPSYGEYVRWLERRDRHESATFFRASLEGMVLPTPLGRPAREGDEAGGRGHVEATREIDTATGEALMDLARRERVTLSTLVQGAWALLLAQYAGRFESVVFGVTLALRPREIPGIDEAIGLYINTLPARVRLAAGQRVGDWLRDINTGSAELTHHGAASLAEIRRWCDLPAATSLFDSIVVFQNYSTPTRAAATELGFTLETPDSVGARTRYGAVLLAAADPHLSLRLVLDDRRWAGGASPERFLGHLTQALRALVAGSHGTLGELGFRVEEAERPALAPTVRRAARRPPADPIEEIVLGVWANLLGRDDLDPDDGFFALGGHSLSAAEAVSRLRDAFHLDLGLRHLIEGETAAGLAREIRRLRGSEAEGDAPDEEESPLRTAAAARFEPFPLTDVQEAYWIGRSGELDLGGVSTHVYSEVDCLGLDLGRFAAAWRRLIDRHDMLRAIVLPDGRQRVLAKVPPWRLATEDLGALSADPAESRLAARREAMSHQVLPADRWPLFDLRAVRLPDRRVRLFVSFDLLIADGWSLGLLYRDLARLYLGSGATLPPLDLTFRDYVVAERRLESTATYRRARTYWLERLERLPPAPELPTVPGSGSGQLAGFRFERRFGTLDAEPWGRLKAAAADRGLTSSALLLAAFSEVLATWSRRPRFTLNLTLFHRRPVHPQVREIVGDFTSLSLLEIDAADHVSFEERTRRIQERLFLDLDHRAFSGVRALRELARRDGGARAAMPIVFTSTLNLGGSNEIELATESEVEAVRFEQVFSLGQTPQVLLDHQVAEHEGALVYNWDSVDAAFPAGWVDTLFSVYARLLERLALNPLSWRSPVGSLVPEEQLARRRARADRRALGADLRLHAGFEARAAERPEAVAVIAPDRRITYGDLDRASGALAERLARRGARPGMLVGVFLKKGWLQAVATLGVLRSGAAYLPLDPELPTERLRELLALGGAELVVVSPDLEERLAGIPRTEPVRLDAEILAAPAATFRAPDLIGSDLAYVIFTSGSTGTPKGVMIDHRGAFNTVADVNERYDIGPQDRVLALSALNFDLSVWDLFGLLGAGGAVVYPTPEEERDPDAWIEWIGRHKVTVWNTVPALLEMLIDAVEVRGDASSLASLSRVLLSGDWIPITLPGRLRRLVPAVRAISLGGATEASIWSIAHSIDTIDPEWASIPYGAPLANQSLQVLDEKLAPRPDGVAGHLYIGGIGLAQGYLRDPVRTALAFVPDPETGGRLYRTGDLGRYMTDGQIEILGREDLQVKVRGHRIELGEIDAKLEQHPDVRSAVTVAVGPPRGSRRLVSFVVAPPGRSAAEAPDALRRHLEASLPDYMVPAAIVAIDELPLGSNGKIDRPALSRRAAGERSAVFDDLAAPFEEPQGPVEQLFARLWQGILGVEKISRHDSFLQAGGDSVQGIQMLIRAREAGFDLSIRELFAEQTIERLARIARPTRSAAEAEPAANLDAGLDAEELADLEMEFDSK